MSEKKAIKTNRRKTARNRLFQTKYLIKNVTGIVSLIETVMHRNKLTNDIFSDIFHKIHQTTSLFKKQFLEIGEKKIDIIENDMSKIKYNRKTDIKSTIFGYIEILNDLGLYLNKEKYKEILETRDEINENLHHFIMLLNDSTFREDKVMNFV
jgi:hypothetical protein